MRLNGLKALKAHQEAQERRSTRSESDEDAKKWMKLKDGMWVKGFFVEELDDEATNYDSSIGTAAIVTEHSGPGPRGYQRRAECTVQEDGHSGCIPHERRWIANRDKTDDWQNWKKATARVYINFHVLESGGEFKDPDTGATIPNPHQPGDTILVSQAADSKQSIMPSLLDYAGDGTILDRPYRISCEGVKKDTTYKLRAYDKEDRPFKPEELERNDLDTAYKSLPYEEQAAYYDSTPGWVPGSTAPSSGNSNSESDSKPSGNFKSW